MLTTSANDTLLPLVDAARERYQIRDYAGVVNLLGSLDRARLLEVPEAAFLLADSGRRAGGVADVMTLAASTVEAARSVQNIDVLCDALNLHGVLLLESGSSQAAERVWCELVIVASEADNPQYVARASNNLGVAAVLAMRLEEAVTSFQRAVAAYLRLGYSRGLAQSHQNLGIVFRELDYEQEAYAHFQSALTWAYAADCPDDVARAEEELALLLLYSGKDASGAASTAQQALNRFNELGEPRGVAQSLRVLGVIALARRDLHEAHKALHTSLEMAREKNMRLLEGEVLLALAALAHLQNEHPDSYQKEQEARALFAEMNAAHWGEQVRYRMSSITS